VTKSSSEGGWGGLYRFNPFWRDSGPFYYDFGGVEYLLEFMLERDGWEFDEKIKHLAVEGCRFEAPPLRMFLAPSLSVQFKNIVMENITSHYLLYNSKIIYHYNYHTRTSKADKPHK